MTAPALRAGLLEHGRARVVGIGEMAIATRADDLLVTYALGSCLGVTVHDPVAGVGGLLHAMLPAAVLDPEKAARNPAMFVDTGVPALFRACYAAGAEKRRLVVRIAGGSAVCAEPEQDQFQIGKRNVLTLRKLLWKNAVLVRSEDVGGVGRSRTLSLHVGTGELRLRCNGVDSFL